MKSDPKEKRIHQGIHRGEPFEIFVDGEPLRAYPGETVAAAMLAAGRLGFRRSDHKGSPRGYYCGMGICWDCAMVVDGRLNLRTCKTLAAPGMKVETPKGLK